MGPDRKCRHSERFASKPYWPDSQTTSLLKALARDRFYSPEPHDSDFVGALKRLSQSVTAGKPTYRNGQVSYSHLSP